VFTKKRPRREEQLTTLARELIEDALQKSNNNQAEVARQLRTDVSSVSALLPKVPIIVVRTVSRGLPLVLKPGTKSAPLVLPCQEITA
jgi:hypothetical protein